MMPKIKIVLLLFVLSLVCVVDSIAVEPLWGTTVESKIDIIDNELSVHDTVVTAKLDVIDNELSVHDTVVIAKLDVIDDELSVHDAVVTAKLDVIDNELSMHDAVVNAKLIVIDDELSVNDMIVNSKLDVVDSEMDVLSSQVDTLTSCGVTPLSTADVSGGTITISSAGTYCLSEDITANITISVSRVSLNLGGHCLVGKITTGSNLNDITIKNGSIVNLSAGGIAIGTSNERTEIKALNVYTSGIGLSINSGDWEISHCTFTVTDAAGTSGTNASECVFFNAGTDRSSIHDCVFSGARGADNSSGNGGRGSRTVLILSSEVEIYNCTILKAGDGGDAGGTGNGGAGGYGIFFSNTSNVAIRNCTIRNTGSGGLGSGGGFNGADGYAISYLGIGSGWWPVGNFAHNIASASKFLVGGAEKGIELSPYPPDGTQTNMSQFGNYFTT